MENNFGLSNSSNLLYGSDRVPYIEINDNVNNLEETKI